MLIPINNDAALQSIFKGILRIVISNACEKIKDVLYAHILQDTYLYDERANKTYVTGYKKWQPTIMFTDPIYSSVMGARTYTNDKGEIAQSELASLQFLNSFRWEDSLEETVNSVANRLFFDNELEVNTRYNFHVADNFAEMFNTSGEVSGKERLPYWDLFIEELNGSGFDSIENILKREFSKYGIKKII